MKNLLFIFGFLFSFVSYSQSLDYNNSFESINICTAIQGNNFASERAADSALDDILNVIGASKRFVLKECSNINNAVALTMNGVRYIMYDPEFMTSLSYGDEWSNKFILAHEVGHHINGHTVDVLAANSSNKVSLSTRRIQELESDEFAGFVLGRLGASLSDALSGVQSLSDKDDSYSTHPRRSKRIAAIKKGFKESGGYVDPSTVSVKKGKTVDSKYSNSRYSNVKYLVLDDYYSDGVYTGYVSLADNKPFGYGEYRGNNGNIYEGEVSGGKWNGFGKYTYANGAVYEGYFVKYKMTGVGVYTYNSGSIDSGNFINGQLNGKGKRIFKDGSVLEGTFLKDKIIKCLYTDKGKEPVEIGFLDGSNGQGIATFTDISGNTYKGKFKDGQVDGQQIKPDINEGRRKYRQVGLARFIPQIVLDGLDIKLPTRRSKWDTNGTGGDRIGHLVEYDKANGIVKKAYYKENFFWSPKRSGFCEQFIPEDYWTESLIATYDKFDTFIGIYWNGERNGYGIKYDKGKVVEKGIYQGGQFVKSEDFDLKLMQETFKKWY
tara:strand:+ start:154 stop:1800 length:1647 start_codon:yes stop_codon:yes gene_type:complete